MFMVNTDYHNRG